jgi:hypothetical protein
MKPAGRHRRVAYAPSAARLHATPDACAPCLPAPRLVKPPLTCPSAGEAAEGREGGERDRAEAREAPQPQRRERREARQAAGRRRAARARQQAWGKGGGREACVVPRRARPCMLLRAANSRKPSQHKPAATTGPPESRARGRRLRRRRRDGCAGLDVAEPENAAADGGAGGGGGALGAAARVGEAARLGHDCREEGVRGLGS